MKFASKLVIIVIILLILGVTYFLISTINKDEKIDNEPPSIQTITGNTTGTLGKISTIYATFSDNIGITEAILYYKTKSEVEWHTLDLINGSADISIPKCLEENYQYFVTVNDADNNGPIGKPSNDGTKYYTIEITSPAEDLIHNVFIEEGTVTWCSDCPFVRDAIHSLYQSEKYNFYYVSMVLDKNEIAEERMKDEYNIFGYPTLFVDGGFSVVTEHNKDESIYTDAIKRAELRNAKKINLTVNAEYLKDTEEIITNIKIESWENDTYNGHLRVYLTEINSRWINSYGSEPKPYHYAFIDYIIDEEVTIDSFESINLTEKNKFTDFAFSDLDPDNLMIVAAVFNSESIEKYSYPPDKNSFNAYFVDNADATKVVEGGDLPPAFAICLPEAGKLHIFGNPVADTIYRNTIIIGRTTVKMCIEDDSDIDKVEFYIDGKLTKTVDNKPYEWSFNKIGFFRNIIRKHTIMVKVYDESGKTSTDSRDVIAVFL